jgi:hypothetical protein
MDITMHMDRTTVRTTFASKFSGERVERMTDFGSGWEVSPLRTDTKGEVAHRSTVMAFLRTAHDSYDRIVTAAPYQTMRVERTMYIRVRINGVDRMRIPAACVFVPGATHTLLADLFVKHIGRLLLPRFGR